ncbi:Hsp33 family molecular chaperone HslO [Methyloglobulus sp.]|uniref:Hsp33 family molecular chaperone HslO n=1 Tax=Methyloglobulus sp. TaxID=2518622 RepID=UPI0032B72374
MSQQDVLRRFMFEELGIRGLWISLSTSWQTARQHQHCAENVQLQLGQALTAVALLSATIKFNGSMILQAQGDGPLKTLVAQATHDRKIRGLIRGSDTVSTGSLQEMFGEGRLVLTVSPANGQPYQGIVPLQGVNLAAALETYFAQSEQLNTRLWLFANGTRASGLLLQELPSQLNDKADWERIEILASTVTEQEMLELDCEELLFRLFNEEKVRLFDAEPVEFDCSCSRIKIENALRMLGRQELESVLQERAQIEVNCEFCNKYYRFDRIDVEQILRSGKNISTDAQTRH